MIDTEKFIKDLAGFAKDPILLNPLMSALGCQGLEVQGGYIVPKLNLGDKVRNTRLGMDGVVIGLAYQYGWIAVKTDKFNPPIRTITIDELAADWRLIPKEKFKVGDTVVFKKGTPRFVIDDIVDGCYMLNGAEVFNIKNQDDWDLVRRPKLKKGDRVTWDGEEFNILDVDEDKQTYNVGGYVVPFARESELKLAGKFKEGDVIVFKEALKEGGMRYTIKEVQKTRYISDRCAMDMSYTDANFILAPKFCVGDFVKHCSNPEIIYRVAKVFEDGTYRIEPTNADMGNAITSATEDCMTLISPKALSNTIGEFEGAIKAISNKVLATDQHVKNTAAWVLHLARKRITEGVDVDKLTREWVDGRLGVGNFSYGVSDAYKQGMIDLLKILRND